MGNLTTNQRVATGEEALPTARPKLLRRPAQFSEQGEKSPAVVSETFELQAIPNSAPPPTSPAAHPWQDDIRFGIVMLVLVIVTNLVLMAWLPHLGHATTSLAPSTAMQGSTMPAPTNTPTPITTYSRSDAMADHAPILSHAVDVHTLSPSTQGLYLPPIPSAHVLDETSGDSDQ